MKRGKTEVETLKLNGWGVGDILESKPRNNCKHRIWITGIGDERFICRWCYDGDQWTKESGSTTLTAREWRRVYATNG